MPSYLIFPTKTEALEKSAALMDLKAGGVPRDQRDTQYLWSTVELADGTTALMIPDGQELLTPQERSRLVPSVTRKMESAG